MKERMNKITTRYEHRLNKDVVLAEEHPYVKGEKLLARKGVVVRKDYTPGKLDWYRYPIAYGIDTAIRPEDVDVYEITRTVMEAEKKL